MTEATILIEAIEIVTMVLGVAFLFSLVAWVR